MYQDIILQFILLLQLKERNCWFQQDNGLRRKQHTHTLHFMETIFDDRLISTKLWF